MYVLYTEMESIANRSTSVRRQRGCSYKIRCFYSKGAFLVIFWMLFFSISFSTFFRSLFNAFILSGALYSYFAIIPALLLMFCAPPIIGWIADIRCGNYKMFRVGIILFLLATVVVCVNVLVSSNVSEQSVVSQILIGFVMNSIVLIVAFIGATACIITALQLGLDQMPDGSSANITSFITWFLFSIILGLYLVGTVIALLTSCIDMSLFFKLPEVSSLFPAIPMSIVCCSLFLLGPKWLIIEPNCPQSLKIIYQVLKFAWKHKSPLNRSALTYWEENENCQLFTIATSTFLRARASII